MIQFLKAIRSTIQALKKPIVKRDFKFNGKSVWCKDHYLHVMETSSHLESKFLVSKSVLRIPV